MEDNLLKRHRDNLLSALLTPINNKPGNIVLKSGIYRVNHDKVHLQPHEVTSVEGERFPPCRNCGPNVTYTLVREAIHLTGHSELGFHPPLVRNR